MSEGIKLIINGLILIIMFLSGYILKEKSKQKESKKLDIARVTISIICLVAIVAVIFI